MYSDDDVFIKVSLAYSSLGCNFNAKHVDSLLVRMLEAGLSAEAYCLLRKIIEDGMGKASRLLKYTRDNMDAIFKLKDQIVICDLCNEAIHGLDVVVGEHGFYCQECFDQTLDSTSISNETIQLTLKCLKSLCEPWIPNEVFQTDFVCSVIFDAFRKAKTTYEEEWPFNCAQESHIFQSRILMGLSSDAFRKHYNVIKRKTAHLKKDMNEDVDNDQSTPPRCKSLSESEESEENVEVEMEED